MPDMQPSEEWDCEAYGPDIREVGALCFIAEPGTRVCSSQAECHQVMTGARKRLFGRISELAAAGDQVGIDLAETFARPEQLLGGEETPDD